MISQLVKYKDEQELRYICGRIQKFIEENGIDVCFVINEEELMDCLTYHNKLKLRIAELELELDKAKKRNSNT